MIRDRPLFCIPTIEKHHLLFFVKILEFNNPFTLMYVEELSHNQGNVLKSSFFTPVTFQLTHRQNLRLRILNNTFTSSAKMFLKQPSCIFEKIAAGFFSSSERKTFSPRHVSNNNIQEAQKGVLQFGKLLICPFGHRERKKARLWGEASCDENHARCHFQSSHQTTSTQRPLNETWQ